MRKTREFIESLLKKANVYSYRYGGEVRKSLL